MFSSWLKFGLFGPLLLLSACGQELSRDQGQNVRVTRETNALLDRFGQEELLRSPEAASRLGLSPEKAGYTYADKLDDRSQANYERTRLARLEMFEAFEQIDDTRLPITMRTNLNVTRSSLAGVIEMSTFGHGQTSLGFTRPFAADQLSGAYIDLPDLLINRQIISNKADAIDYIDRLAKVGDAIDDDRRRMIADAQIGIIPPDFILARMLEISRRANQTEPGTFHPILAAFEGLSTGANDLTAEEYQQMLSLVARLIEEQVRPAYERFEATLETLSRQATATPGIWPIPDGEAYYEAATRFYTGQDAKPAELHNQGLAIVAQLTSELDTALHEAGFSEGSIYERLQELNALPDQIFPNTPEGRAALLASLSARLQETQPEMARLIPSPPRANLRVAQVPEFLSANAPGGYYSAAPADRTTPSIFYINLRDTNEWPAYTLPTLFYHEAIPGHHLESTVIAEQGNLPIVRQLIWLPVYGEGWALYAEDLANELGVYTDDPLGKVGYLQSLLFRAARLVTDTGIHYQRWSRERAVNYLVETTGQSRSAMETEVERYAIWPGQAVSYMIGRQFIWHLRQRSTTALGNKFDLTAFHQTILANGPRPLHLIEADIDAWIQSELAD